MQGPLPSYQVVATKSIYVTKGIRGVCDGSVQKTAKLGQFFTVKFNITELKISHLLRING